MSGDWRVSQPIGGASPPGTPVVSLRQPLLRIEAIHFATPRTGRDDFHWLYFSSNTHPRLPGRNLRWWGRGRKLNQPEWIRGRQANENYRACFTRSRPVSMAVKLVAAPSGLVPFKGALTVTPTVDGSPDFLRPATANFHYPAGASEHWVNIVTDGALPNEVGRYILRFQWTMSGAGFNFGGPDETRHKVYAAHGRPLQPGYDSATVADTGRQTTRDEGTLTGTGKRLDHMMRLIGGRMRRHPVATREEINNLYWKLHVGINDTPGAPPYFNGVNDEHITTGPGGTGDRLPLEDMWLAWVPNSEQWNDASCIGHVQIAKTMLAAVGLFARRTWVFPHTSRLPNGTTRSFADTDLFCLGNYDPSKLQTWTFRHGARSYVATPYLMEPDESWEFFEACLLTPGNKFLPGGYTTRSCPASFRANSGFNSAAELLRWWCSTSRRGFGRRFMAWVYYNESTNEVKCWDVDGVHYNISDYVQIRQRGKHLPPP